MNRGQRRQRIARINKAKKAAKKAHAMTRQDFERTAVIAEEFVATDKEFVGEYSSKLIRIRKKFFVFSALCVIFGGMLFFDFDGAWNVFLFYATFVLSAMQVAEYGTYRGRLPFWKQQLQENEEFLNSINLRLQQFTAKHAT